MIYFELFWSFFQIGLFSIGGGYAAMPLIQHQAVDVHSWLTMTQFADIMTIAEMTPGPIAINSATFVGIQTAGLPGAVIATFGCITPSCVIVMTLAYVYYRFRGLTMVQGILAGLDVYKRQVPGGWLSTGHCHAQPGFAQRTYDGSPRTGYCPDPVLLYETDYSL